MNFLGYRRPDGKVGIRNKVLILPASVCAADTARIVAEQVTETVTFHNQSGCSQVSSDLELTLRTMVGFAANPNIYGTVVIALGCEGCQLDIVMDEIRKVTNKPLKGFIIQECGGTVKTAEMAVRAAKEMVQEASMLQREEFPLSELILGTECGGSDPTSGIASNPLIGEVCDRLIDNGGTAILSEVPEFIGGEHILARRGRTPEVGQQILDVVHRFEADMARVGEEIRNGNPTPGNKAGGITTLEEKSLGCIHKSGHRPIEAVYDYAMPVDKKGLVIVDTPGNDPSSVAGMVASGAQIVIFSTGRGTPTGNPIAPVIKITANKRTYGKMSDNIDIDCSRLLEEPEAMPEVADATLQEIINVANGKITKSESLGFRELAIARVCNYV
ncbi:MAG: UxaA family hydrolase [Clostridiales bacterium]|nr:UxaA family hydrolase [Clostridiales bacterium]MDO5140578.1 UxaA family hydrolase [Eubacteriales bacterium]